MRLMDDEETLVISLGDVAVEGDLLVPPDARGLVLFAHGSGSSRKSSRNRFVARTLHDRGFGTLLFDLLTADEETLDAIDAHLRFDIPLLAERLVAVTDRISEHPKVKGLPLGYFGASTGAAAALIAAVARPELVRAIVSRGGRPDLAGGALDRVYAPTLLIVGGEDRAVLELNQRALRKIPAPKRLEVVPGATHLFEEPGALEEVAGLAADWFVEQLAPAARPSARGETRPGVAG